MPSAKIIPFPTPAKPAKEAANDNGRHPDVQANLASLEMSVRQRPDGGDGAPEWIYIDAMRHLCPANRARRRGNET